MAPRRPNRRSRTSGARPQTNASRHDSRPTTTPDRRPPVIADDDRFAALGVTPEFCELLADQGITDPFPIQASTLPDSLAGRDVLGRGRTGSGKTLAFGLAVLTRLDAIAIPRTPNRPRALILAPTRELALQIDATIAPLAQRVGLRTTTIFGGVGQFPQVDALRRGVDIVVACPGRLQDLIDQGHCRLDRVEICVLDEADHMADLGFLPGVKKLLDQVPASAQHLLFSATLDKGIDVIVKRYLHDPVTHSVDSEQSPVHTMTHHVLHVKNDDRVAVVVDLAAAPGRTIVFTRTKHRAKQLAKQLNANGVTAVELQGNLSQAARTRNLSAFADGRAAALVATDIAARGIHVDDVSLVIHADPPIEHKAYLHRSGRTARAGNEGVVVTIATESQRTEVAKLMKKAGIDPIITKADPRSEILAEIAPGQRLKRSRSEVEATLGLDDAPRPGGRPNSRRPAKAAGATSSGRGGRGTRRASTKESPGRDDGRTSTVRGRRPKGVTTVADAAPSGRSPRQGGPRRSGGGRPGGGSAGGRSGGGTSGGRVSGSRASGGRGGSSRRG